MFKPLALHPLFVFLILLCGIPCPPAFADDNCPNSSAPQDKIAVAFGYAIYSDLVRGSTIEGAGHNLCVDESGNVTTPVTPPLVCSLTKGTENPDLSYDSDSGSLVANITDMSFETTDVGASVTFQVESSESPSGSEFLLKSADFSSSSNGLLELASGVPFVIARANDGNIPFTAEFTNGHLAGLYSAVVVVTCRF